MDECIFEELIILYLLFELFSTDEIIFPSILLGGSRGSRGGTHTLFYECFTVRLCKIPDGVLSCSGRSREDEDFFLIHGNGL